MPPSPGPGSGATIQLKECVAESGVKPGILPAKCVLLDEFLTPAELQELVAYTLGHEPEFVVSEVISPGVMGGKVDFEHRRSKVLMELGKYLGFFDKKLQSMLPSLLPRLECKPFPFQQLEMQITASNNGDYFRWHSDNAHDEIASRQVTFVYFFHREPKQFQGGELKLYDSQLENGIYVPMENCRTIVPQQNQAVLFLSSLTHEITPVECLSQQFADSRFTVNGWVHK
jgi:Rps23 Pro-64 3,4-dihydroxylase Tpa1-like proline 4-hydroxylase